MNGVRGRVGNGGGRSGIEDMSEILDSNAPETCRQSSLVEHGNNPFCKCLVKSFCNTILLRCRSDGVLTSDPLSAAPCVKILPNIFSSFVVPELFNLLLCCPFSLGNKLFECVKGITFTFEEGDFLVGEKSSMKVTQ